MFLNLGIGQFFAAFGAIAVVSVLLYLLDRNRRKQVVSTLRFWVTPGLPSPVSRRRKIQQPLSLLLQLLGMLLLLLAIGELHWGGSMRARRDHVLIIDTSAWMRAAVPGRPGANLMDVARANAISWLRAVPDSDRVLLVRADALATPATAWETNHVAVAKAILETKPGATALNLDQSLAFARQLQKQTGTQGGEVVYDGPGRIGQGEADAGTQTNVPALRYLQVSDPSENVGLRSIGARRSSSARDSWDVLVTLRNYGKTAKTVNVTINLGHVPMGAHPVAIPAASDQQTTFEVPTKAAGIAEVRVYPADPFVADNYAAIELPAQRSLHVVVYTDSPEQWKPALEADSRVNPEFHPTRDYKAGNDGLIILDRFRPEATPSGNTLWIDPPEKSPISVRERVIAPEGLRWAADQQLSAGLREHDLQIPATEILEPGTNDIRVAEVNSGTVIAARVSPDGKTKTIVMGFDPFAGSLRYELAAPLLLANELRWFAPDVFRDVDVTAQNAGSVSDTLTIPAGVSESDVKVISEGGTNLPFNIRNGKIQFFTGRATRVSVIAGNLERAYSLTLPEMWDTKWTPPAGVRRGIPAWNDAIRRSTDLWPWLALLGAAVLILEYLIYGRETSALLRVIRAHMDRGESGMTFEHPWLLLLTILPVGWCVYEWNKHTRHFALITKCVMLLMIALALAGPILKWRETKVALAVVADTSASLSPQDLAHEQNILKQISSSQGSNELKVIPFARAPREMTSAESDDYKLAATSGAAGRGTNLEAPVRNALASLPSGMLHRILLISDGNENEGALSRAAWQAKQIGVPIDTIALAGRDKPQILVEALGLPPAVFTGEEFPVDLTIYTPRAGDVSVDLEAEGKSIGAHSVALTPGENRVRILTRLNATGAIDVSGTVQAAGMGSSRFEGALSVRRPKVTWITQDEAGMEKQIASLLAVNKFDFSMAKSLPQNLDDSQILVFNNVNFEAMDPADKGRIEKFVQSGGGALWIAGENNVYVDHKDKPEDAVERTFPAKLAPPREPEDTVVVLVIDKSASMEGKKIELSRAAATGVVENLKPEDQVGILIFDNSFQWTVPVGPANDKARLKRLIAGINPDGGTQIPAALNEAYKKVLPFDKATFRHIVLLTDGISEEGDSVKLAKDAADHKITISAIGLGQDVNRPYLEKLASTAGGKSYFLNDPAGLEQILLHDVKEHTGTVAIEKPIAVDIKHPSDLLDKVDMTKAPNLKGYVRFEAKPSADEVLQADGKDPLLVHWQYGLGRSAVFASDAKARWASDWLSWNGFDTLWTNIFRDLLPRGAESEATPSFDAANQDLVVDYHLSLKSDAPDAPPDIFAIGPGDFRKPVQLSRVSPLDYRARVHIGETQGLFRVRPLNDSRIFPEVGLYRPEEELNEYGSNPNLLKSVAEATGGRFNADPGQAFANDGQAIESSARLWPVLLALAILLNLVELVMRKWRGIVETVRTARRPATA